MPNLLDIHKHILRAKHCIKCTQINPMQHRISSTNIGLMSVYNGSDDLVLI